MWSFINGERTNNAWSKWITKKKCFDKKNMREWIVNQSNFLYPMEEEIFGIVNHLWRKRRNPLILILKRIRFIFLVKQPHPGWVILDFDNLTIFTYLLPAFASRKSVIVMTLWFFLLYFGFLHCVNWKHTSSLLKVFVIAHVCCMQNLQVDLGY